MKKTYSHFTTTALMLIVALFMVKCAPKKSEKTTNVFDESTKYEGVFVHTVERQQLDQRLLLHVSYPVVEGNEKINNHLEKMAQAFMAQYEKRLAEVQKLKKKADTLPPTVHGTFLQHFDVSFANDDYIAFVIDRYVNTGNTGSNSVFTKLFSRKTGEEITLDKLFTSGDYLNQLSELSRHTLLEQMKADLAKMNEPENIIKQQREMRKEMILSGTEPKAENFDSYRFTENGTMQIIFDKYQVAAGNRDTVQIEIPIQKIADILQPELRKILHIAPSEEDTAPADQKSEKPKKKEANQVKDKTTGTTDCKNGKCIALTFDDGPSVYTPKLLDILKEKGVKATFFVLGQSAKIQRNTIKRMLKEGHVIGNHSWNHKDLRKLSAEAIHSQIDRTNAVVKEIAGEPLKLVRPPYGAIDQTVRKAINAPLILWNIDSEDWKYRNTEHVVNEIVSHAKPGAIILSHDIYKTTINAIPQVIDSLREQGYHFVTVPELFANSTLQPGHTYRHR